MIRAAIGIAVAGEAVRVAAAVPALVGRADDPPDRRNAGAPRGCAAPISVCRRMNAHSSSVERPRLLRGPRRGSRACRRRAARPRDGAPRASRRLRPSRVPTRDRELGDARDVVAQARLALLERCAAAPRAVLAPRSRAGASARRGAGRRARARRRIVASSGSSDAPNAARDAEAVAVLVRGCAVRSRSRCLCRGGGASTQNSSPPSRKALPPVGDALASLPASRASSASPAGWPKRVVVAA